MKPNKKVRSVFDLHIEPIKIPRYRISPQLLDILAERKRKKRIL